MSKHRITEKDVEAYVAGGGCQCPACGSDQIEGSSFDADGKHVWQKVWCNDCEAEWFDDFTLTTIRVPDAVSGYPWEVRDE